MHVCVLIIRVILHLCTCVHVQLFAHVCRGNLILRILIPCKKRYSANWCLFLFQALYPHLVQITGRPHKVTIQCSAMHASWNLCLHKHMHSVDSIVIVLQPKGVTRRQNLLMTKDVDCDGLSVEWTSCPVNCRRTLDEEPTVSRHCAAQPSKYSPWHATAVHSFRQRFPPILQGCRI